MKNDRIPQRIISYYNLKHIFIYRTNIIFHKRLEQNPISQIEYFIVLYNNIVYI